MDSILIDYEKIIGTGKNHPNLVSKISPLPQKNSKYTLGLILVAPKKQIIKLSTLSKGRDRVNYLNKPEFVNKISNFFFVRYNQSQGVCEFSVDCGKDEISKILQALKSLKNTELVVNLPVKNKSFVSCLKLLTNKGFYNPSIEQKNTFGEKIPHSLVLTCGNNEKKTTLADTIYVLEHYKRDSCSVKVRFDKSALKFLRKLAEDGDGSEGSQKEIGGELHIVKVEERKSPIYVIGVDEQNIIQGKEEEIKISPSRYNFHSHPREAYVKHSVKHAWPSLTDYFGYLKLGSNTIFHCVTTLEGLYIISFSAYWGKREKEIDKNFIKKYYDHNKDSSYTPNKYVNEINTIKSQGHSIFEVKFLPWKKAEKIFSVSFTKNGLTCLPR